MLLFFDDDNDGDGDGDTAAAANYDDGDSGGGGGGCGCGFFTSLFYVIFLLYFIIIAEGVSQEEAQKILAKKEKDSSKIQISFFQKFWEYQDNNDEWNFIDTIHSSNIIVGVGCIVGGCIVSGCIVGGCIVGGCIVAGCIVDGCIVGGCMVGGWVHGGWVGAWWVGAWWVCVCEGACVRVCELGSVEI